MPIIFIRHADKGTKTADEALLPNQGEKTAAWGMNLIGMYGKPDHIISSPYLRTRQTASLLDIEGVPLLVDNDLREKLPPHKKRKRGKGSARWFKLHDETMSHYPWTEDPNTHPFLHPDDIFNIISRTNLLLARYQHQNVWLICHGCYLRALSMIHWGVGELQPTLSVAVVYPDKLIIHAGPQG